MSKTKERIRDSQLRYKQGLGQNFIYDDDLLQALVRLSGVTDTDDVLEIEPGSGSMTKHLCHAAHHVLSIELDERLIPLLDAFMHDCDNFTLVQGDVMQLNLSETASSLRKPLSVVANIPYYITTPLITLLLTCGLPIRSLSLMVQKEVADKILSSPGTDGWGMLAVRCQYLCEPELLMDVPAACFTPPPKVDSAFVQLTWRDSPAIAVRSEADFFRVAAAAFALRRKTMANNLCATFHLSREDAVSLITSAGLDEKVRGEKLTLAELGTLSDAYTLFKEKKYMTIARFDRVSAVQYALDAEGFPVHLPVEEIPLPCRATAGSAGYDVVCPVEVTLAPGQQATIPTGLRVLMQPGWVLISCPRSSLGRKHGLRLANTIGVIDSDYVHADNEGHWLVSLLNGGDHTVTLHPGDRICQGIFLPYGLAEEAEVTARRSGGYGSTGI